MPLKDKLTPKQEIFIKNIVSGMNQREAYKNSYNAENMCENTIDKEACLLFNNPKIAERYKELIEELKDEAIMTAKERMIWLSNVVKGKVTHTSYDSNGNAYDNEAYISDKLKAIDTLNKMSGKYITTIKGDLNLSYEEALKKVSELDEY